MDTSQVCKPLSHDGKSMKYLLRITKIWRKDTKWANAIGNGTNRLDWHKVAQTRQLVKNATSAKNSTVKCKKLRYACSLTIYHYLFYYLADTPLEKEYIHIYVLYLFHSISNLQVIKVDLLKIVLLETCNQRAFKEKFNNLVYPTLKSLFQIFYLIS